MLVSPFRMFFWDLDLLKPCILGEMGGYPQVADY